MNFTKVFDGFLPASLNPGVDFGATVTVWTPTKSGVYAVQISAPDEPNAPFMYADNVTVDMAAAGGIYFEPLFMGSIGPELQTEVFAPGDPLKLKTTQGHAVRAVVKVALVVSSDVVGGSGDMVVGLDELKAGLGIALDDVSEDENLVALEEKASAWAEERLERRFHAPAERIEYVKGNGTPTLWLWGNVEDPTLLVVAERSRSGGSWEDLENDEADPTYELRTSARVQKLERMDGSVWSRGMEYRVTWQDGYTLAPADIRALIVDAVNQQRNALIAVNDEGTIKSESIGDYSYTLDLSVAAGALAAGFSNVSDDTINRWRRVHR